MGEGEGGIRGKQIPAFHKDAVNAEMPPVTLHAPEIRAKGPENRNPGLLRVQTNSSGSALINSDLL